MRRTVCALLSAALIVCLYAASASAQEKNAAAPAAPAGNVVTVAEVRGGVEVRPGANQPWQPATAGMQLGPDWEISTGLRGQAVLRFEDSSVVVVQRLTQMTIREFARTPEVVKTRVDVKYGSVRVQVEKKTAANDFKVSSPTATASVTGTKIEEFSYYRGFGSQIRMGSEGHVQYKVNPTMTLGPGEQTDDLLTDPVAYAKMTVWVPLNFPGLTGPETQSSIWHGTPFAGVWDNLRPTSPLNANQTTQGQQGPPPPPPPPPPNPPPPIPW